MSTFSDLLMLMLTFFVLLLTMSSLDDREIRQAMRDGLMVTPQDREESALVESQMMLQGPAVDKEIEELKEQLKLPYPMRSEKKIKSLVSRLFEATNLEGHAWVEHRPWGLSINVDGTISFREDSDQLTTRARVLLNQLLQVVGPDEFNFAVQTYLKVGDDFGSARQGWDLALRRADTVARFVLERGIAPERLRIMGYGLAAGTREKRFLRQSSLVEIRVLTGEPSAESVDADPTGSLP